MLTSITGKIERIIKHETSKFTGNKFLIAAIDTGGLVMGNMRTPSKAHEYVFHGEWKKSKNPRYTDESFHFCAYEVPITRDVAGYAKYLQKSVRGIGSVIADRICETYKDEVFDVILKDPERLGEVKGVTPEIIKRIKDSITEDPFEGSVFAKLYAIFSGTGISEWVAKEIYKSFGSGSHEVVKENPYILMNYPSLGWKRVDDFALGKMGVDRKSEYRKRAAVAEAVTQASGDGHTIVTPETVIQKSNAMLGYRIDEDFVNQLIDEGLISSCEIREKNYISDNKIFASEDIIARELERIFSTARPLSVCPDTSGLEEGQAEAVKLFARTGAVIIAGAPGTGKTFVSSRIMLHLEKVECDNVLVCAPTGKAAVRVSELLREHDPDSKIRASTIHKALEPSPNLGDADEGVPSAIAKTNRGRNEFGFGRHKHNPIDATAIQVDELSMLDTKIGASLLESIADGTRLLIVGDPNQLSSVGPGSVLRDLIAGGVPSVTLDKVRRSVGLVVESCHKIKAGKTPKPARKLDLGGGQNWAHFETGNHEQTAEVICDLYRKYSDRCGDGESPFWKDLSPLWDIQIISPQKEIAHIGTKPLNESISAIANPDPPPSPLGSYEFTHFNIGDKVIRSEKNEVVSGMVECPDGPAQWGDKSYRYEETPIVNGDMGQVLDICMISDSPSVIVLFRNPDRLVRLPYKTAKLERAYAVTCHKAQGSGFRVVIAPVSTGFYYDPQSKKGLWVREMLYTIFSRSSGFLVTVGSRESIAKAVVRPTIDQRRTRLGELISASKYFNPGEVESLPR